MLIAIIMYLIIGAIRVYMTRTELNCIITSYQVVRYYSILGVILFYAICVIIAPVCILCELCKNIFNKVTKRES
jgi:hypothetical protein